MNQKNTEVQPFTPHFSDSIVGFFEKSKFPFWGFYVLIFFSFGLLLNVVDWVFQGVPYGTFNSAYLFGGVWITEYLLINHFAIRFAGEAFGEFRSSLNLSQEEIAQHEFDFRHIPAGRGWAWFLFGAGFGAVVVYYLTESQLPMSVYLPSSYLLVSSSAGTSFFFVAGYRIFRQLDKVNQLFDMKKSISLFDLGPIYSLALFPVKIVLLTVIFLYVNPFFYIFGGILADPVILVIWLIFTLMAIIVIIAPLRGINRRLNQAKDESLRRNGNKIDEATERLYEMVGRIGSTDAANIENGLRGLIAVRKELDSISTWPWKSDTIRWLVTALILPLGLWIIQWFLQRTLGA